MTRENRRAQLLAQLTVDLAGGLGPMDVQPGVPLPAQLQRELAGLLDIAEFILEAAEARVASRRRRG